MLGKSILSIEFGSKYIKIMQSKLSNKQIVIEKIENVEVGDDIFKDGYIVDSEKVKKIFEKVINKGTFSCRKVICTTKSTTVISRILNVPMAKEKELENILSFEIQEQLPINLAEYILDYKILGEIKQAEETYYKVNVILYPKKLAEGYWELFKQLKLKPIALDLNYNCIEKLFNSRHIKFKDEIYGQEDAFAVVDLGYSNIEINIIQNKKVVFSRIIQNGGQSIDEAILGQIFVEDDKIEDVKVNFIDLMKENGEASTKKEMVNNLAKSVVDTWIRDIDRVLDYYRNENRDKMLSRVYLHGGCSNINGLEEYMEVLMNLPIKKVHEIRNIKSYDIRFNKNSERYLNTIGATIRLK
ncbi:type IV pilus assembly protein PilM [Clostridium sp. DL1XJH146]